MTKEYPNRGDIYWVSLDPTVGTEIKKKRPALIISPSVANDVCPRVILAPITSNAVTIYPFQVKITLKDIDSKILLDQIRTVDKARLGKKMASLDEKIMKEVDKAIKIALGIR